jgi:glycosyltransferase involved in cell wall biosynthesis
MEIHFFERKIVEGQLSIEKLFSVLYRQLEDKKINFKVIKNPYSLSQFWKSLFFFKNQQGDINHITGDIHWACLFLDKNKTILTIHDLVGLYQYTGIKKWLYYILWVYLPIKKLKYITVISEKTKQEVLKYMPSAEKKIHVISNFVIIPILENTTATCQDKIRVLVVGTRSNKNIERILQALINIDVKITIIGELEESHEHIIKANNMQINSVNNISDDELIEKYYQSDILLFPSLYEGFGLPILEAQAQNCCVITSNISPMKEIAGGAAILVDPFSVEEIRNAVIKLVNSKEERKNLLEKGKENVMTYSPEKISHQYINLYNKILNQ